MWKLLLALAANFGLFVAGPLLLVRWNLMPPVAEKAWAILLCTAVILCIKTIVGDFASGEFKIHKHGYDFCITTLGASMASFSIQLVADKNLFPGVRNVPFGATMAGLITEPLTLTYSFLAGMLALSMFATLLTARISRAVSKESPKFPDLLAMMNVAIGALIVGLYVLLIIVKE